MRKAALYSPSPRAPKVAGNPPTPRKRRSWRDVYTRHRRPLLASAAGLFVLIALLVFRAEQAPALTLADVDAAVVRALQEKQPPSPYALAYDAVRASVVRVHADDAATGSGVVIVESGVILTNLHVVQGRERIGVVFANGHRSEAKIVSAQPENDLAVIQALVLPDDLKPATLGSARDLVEGDHVIAVGFPFGIGPSVSAGVISGLGREYRAPGDSRALKDLIQFDAAANPGSSGGPLVNAAGEVVGIVTAILSPAEKGTFAGIAFAVPIRTAAAAAGLPPF
ncbi:MAG TPA: trypsin-like peptidase domain-containing protein [Burkholderiales bacterium]|nr:trypsin-like peptidase domain-containing protein [Burkholderiales bacterium]